jgi:hypothetical protein
MLYEELGVFRSRWGRGNWESRHLVLLGMKRDGSADLQKKAVPYRKGLCVLYELFTRSL